MELDETEQLALRAMQRVQSESNSRKSVVTLRYMLLETKAWNPEIEYALCNGGNEEPLVAKYYGAVCQLARNTVLVDGAGDLGRPAGPRYTECWITPAGIEWLNQCAERVRQRE